MKNLKSIIGMLLLISLITTFVNCTKDDPEPTSPTFNYSTFTDARDGKTYKYIKIGTQEWMAENLAYQTTSGSWYSYGSEIEGAKYGRLYTFEAAKKAVPDGWHLPTDEEWKNLEMTLGMSQSVADGIDYRGTEEGKKLKATKGWPKDENSKSGNGIDLVGFSALPGGMRANSGQYYVLGWLGFWWTSTEYDISKVWIRGISYNSSQISRNPSYIEDAFSVRCVRN